MSQPSAESYAADLINGAFDDPLWGRFLDRLCQSTDSAIVTLVFQPLGWARDDALILVSGASTVEKIRASYRKYSYPDAFRRREWMENGRPYCLSEFIELEGIHNDEFFRALKSELGVADVLEMRVQEAGGVEAWLSLVHGNRVFPSEVATLLQELAPMLAGVLRSYLTLEQERFSANLARDAIKRMQYGWIALDEKLTVLETDAFAGQLLAKSGGISRDALGRLRVSSAHHSRELEQAMARLCADPGSRPVALQLRADPWLDVLLVPARQRVLSNNAAAKVIAYVHGDNWRSADRHSQLAELFSLTDKEARLALALCRGSSIAEAAPEIGLTVQSARVYSKAIFAKTGARGQADLVRIMMGSILALSPD